MASQQHTFSLASPHFTNFVSVSDLSRSRLVDRRGCGVVYQLLRDSHFYEDTQLTALATTTLQADRLFMPI
jgi:hypothetical protein